MIVTHKKKKKIEKNRNNPMEIYQQLGKSSIMTDLAVFLTVAEKENLRNTRCYLTRVTWIDRLSG